MVTVRLPSLLQPLAGGATIVEARGATLRAVIDDVVRQHPGLRNRIADGGGMRPDVMIAIGSDEAAGIDAAVPEGSEVHILPAIAGGASRSVPARH